MIPPDSHLLHLSKGTVVKSVAMSEVDDYNKLVADGCHTPLYNVIRGWIYKEYETDEGKEKPWRKACDMSDGRLPNLGLAGPFQTVSG